MSLPTRALGKDGPQVLSLGAGLMSLAHAYGHAGDDEERFTFLDALYEMGETNWDDADIYGDSEDVVGKWFARTGKRSEIFLSTKFGFTDMTGGSVRTDPEYIHQAIEKSLKRLQTDYVDLYYMHRTDGKTPIEKTVEAMVELKKQGKIRHLGLSEVSSKTLRRAHAIHPISALQVEYSPFALEIESEQTKVLATCKELGIAVVAYSPLGRGFLTGQVKSRADIENDWRAALPKFSEENFPKNLELVSKIEAVAQKKGITPSQLTLAWLLKQWEGVIPIPGTRRISAMKENLESLKVELSDEENKEIRHMCENAGVFGARYPEVMMSQVFADTPEL